MTFKVIRAAHIKESAFLCVFRFILCRGVGFQFIRCVGYIEYYRLCSYIFPPIVNLLPLKMQCKLHFLSLLPFSCNLFTFCLQFVCAFAYHSPLTISL